MTIEQTIDIQPNHRLILDLPFELPLGRAKVEITVTPERKEAFVERKSAFGCLHQFADPSKIPSEEGAWERAVLKNYADTVTYNTYI